MPQIELEFYRTMIHSMKELSDTLKKIEEDLKEIKEELSPEEN